MTTTSGTSEAEASNSYIPLPSPWGGQEDCPPYQTEVIWSTLIPNKTYLALMQYAISEEEKYSLLILTKMLFQKKKKMFLPNFDQNAI